MKIFSIDFVLKTAESKKPYDNFTLKINVKTMLNAVDTFMLN